jgi:hypothetical protein
MPSDPRNLQALLAKVLSKILIAIDALTSLRDVPTILEDMALRLSFVEHAMVVWRQAQSPSTQFKAKSTVR